MKAVLGLLQRLLSCALLLFYPSVSRCTDFASAALSSLASPLSLLLSRCCSDGPQSLERALSGPLLPPRGHRKRVASEFSDCQKIGRVEVVVLTGRERKDMFYFVWKRFQAFLVKVTITTGHLSHWPPTVDCSPWAQWLHMLHCGGHTALWLTSSALDLLYSTGSFVMVCPLRFLLIHQFDLFLPTG